MIPPPWHALAADAVLDGVGGSRAGLRDADAAARVAAEGPNALPTAPAVSVVAILTAQFRGVVVLLLVGALVASLLFGDRLDALLIAVVLAINSGFGFVSELRARRAMAGVLQQDIAAAVVLRDGVLRRVDARELARGDVIELTAGACVPADSRLLDAVDFRVDEAPLTGESLPVEKTAAAVLPVDTVLADRVTMTYKGTLVVSGAARGVVTATGANTELGKVGRLTASVAAVKTPLERRLDILGSRLGWAALGAVALVASIDASRRPLPDAIRTAIALAIAAVPEALPAVATIALAIGMQRMAARRALVRRLPVVEALGSATIICTDKTRTLTTGRMAVVEVRAADRRRALLAAARASRAQPRGASPQGERGDPVDAAVRAAAGSEGLDAELAGTVALIPFSTERKLMAEFHRSGGALIASVKGAPQQVLARCATDAAEAMALNDELARGGLRVIAVAQGAVSAPTEDALTGLEYVGLIGLADPPAPGVADAVRRLRDAGLRTIMLTGDQRLTAEAIGRTLGIPSGDIHSRVTPEEKLRVISELQAQGEIVAMIGDGINDAPALRRADIGIAMGGRGTDTAKAAAGIVLQDDRFDTILPAVEQGRVIFDNIRRFVFYLFSCNLAEILVLLIAGLAALPPPLLPLQILWLNLVTDTFPALALALEPGDPDVMQRPPREPAEAILPAAFVRRIVLYAGLITASTLAAYWRGAPDAARAATMAFMTMAIAQILHLGNARGSALASNPRHAIANRYALAGAAVALLLQLASAAVAPLARLLGVVTLNQADWLAVIGSAALPAIAGEVLRWRRASSR